MARRRASGRKGTSPPAESEARRAPAVPVVRRRAVAWCGAAVLPALLLAAAVAGGMGWLGAPAWAAAAAARAQVGGGTAGSDGTANLSGLPRAADGAPPPPATPQARRREAELAALRAEIAQLTARLEAARQQQSGIEGELAAADLALSLEEKRLAEATAARDAAADREAASAAEVNALTAALAERREDFRRQIVGLYRLGRQGYLRLFSALKPDARLLPSIRLVRYLVLHDREVIDRYQETHDRLARRSGELAAERLERETWVSREQERRHALVGARERKAALLTRLRNEQSALAVRTADLTEREQKLAAFLNLLYGQSSAALAGTPMQQFRGVLDWPAAGPVVERFGPQLDPRYRTKVPHNGIDLATSAGSEVKVVYPGKILYAAAFEGYGLTVVAHHPGRVLTLYAGLSELRKAKDDMVSLGDPVGLAADRLYFEIRVENHPEDPLTWLHNWVR